MHFWSVKKCSRCVRMFWHKTMLVTNRQTDGVPALANVAPRHKCRTHVNTRLNNSDMNTGFLLPLCLQLIMPREFLKAFLCIWVTVTKRKHFSPVMAGRSRSRTWINSAQSSGTRKILQKSFPRRQSPIAIELRAFRREISLRQIGNVLGINRLQIKRPSFRFNCVAHWQHPKKRREKKLKPDNLECKLKLASRQPSQLADEFIFTRSAKSR